MRFLLDTAVLAETRRARPNPDLLRWLGAQTPDLLAISAISLTEIQRDLAVARRQDHELAPLVERWLATLQSVYADRILDIDRAVALRWGHMAGEAGRVTPDLAIAATAHVHRLVVATRKADDFLRAGVPVLNPFQPSPQIIRPRV